MSRTIEIHSYHQEKPGVPLEELWKALGRIVNWGDPNIYANVKIFDDGSTDFIVNYSDSNGRRLFVMGVIWNPTTQKYAYHS